MAKLVLDTDNIKPALATAGKSIGAGAIVVAFVAAGTVKVLGQSVLGLGKSIHNEANNLMDASIVKLTEQAKAKAEG